jgi:hypothetical protein
LDGLAFVALLRYASCSEAYRSARSLPLPPRPPRVAVSPPLPPRPPPRPPFAVAAASLCLRRFRLKSSPGPGFCGAPPPRPAFPSPPSPPVPLPPRGFASPERGSPFVLPRPIPAAASVHPGLEPPPPPLHRTSTGRRNVGAGTQPSRAKETHRGARALTNDRRETSARGTDAIDPTSLAVSSERGRTFSRAFCGWLNNLVDVEGLGVYTGVRLTPN